MTRSADADVDPVYATLRATARFACEHLVSIVGISVCWFLAALPIVTAGPATVGAYRAVLSLRAPGADGVDRATVLATVRRQFVHATLLGLVPFVLLGISAAYAVTYLRTGALAAGLLAVVGFNAAVYAWLVSVPTLVELARGESPADALTAGCLWTARHGVGALALLAVTVALFAVTSLLTVAVVLLFAGVTFAFHVEFVGGLDGIDEFTTADTDTTATSPEP